MRETSRKRHMIDGGITNSVRSEQHSNVAGEEVATAPEYGYGYGARGNTK